MSLPVGRHVLGPGTATILVRTYREGVAAHAGHDLIIELTRWEATVQFTAAGSGSTIELSADPRSLEVREGVHGLKPLSDRDRAEIAKTIDAKVLRGAPIAFRSSSVEPAGDDGRLTVTGQLELAGRSGPLAFELQAAPDGRVEATATVTQTAWGITPHSALMGTLKVRDAVDVTYTSGG